LDKTNVELLLRTATVNIVVQLYVHVLYSYLMGKVIDPAATLSQCYGHPPKTIKFTGILPSQEDRFTELVCDLAEEKKQTARFASILHIALKIVSVHPAFSSHSL
jgi:hypothetical protein